MVTIKTVEFNDLMLEADALDVEERIDNMLTHIRNVVPDEILFKPSGELNPANKWGSIYMHLSLARGTLRAFST